MKRYLFVAASICILAACSGLEQTGPETPTDGDWVERVVFNVLPIQDGDAVDTKASAVPIGGNVGFAWEATDTVGIYPNSGSQIYFNIEDGVGTSSVSFNGGGWALKQNNSYTSYYPFVGDIYLKANKIPVSFAGQKQIGTEPPFRGARYYLATDASSSVDGVLTFIYNTLNTIINVNATLPPGTYTKASITTDEPLFVEEGTYSLDDHVIVGSKFTKTLDIELADFTLTTESTVPVYIMSAPVDLTGKEVTVKFYSSDGRKYKCVKTPSRPYIAGNRHGLTCVMEDYYGDDIVFADETVKRACVEKYDTDGDGELSFAEAAAVTNIDGLFDNYRYIQSFDEFQYFTSVTYIPARCFARMTILKSIILPESITSIGDYAFTECSSLTSFILPNNVRTIGVRAFVKCSSLKTFEFEENSKLYSLSGWTYYDIDGNSREYSGLFGFCTSLESITIPASVSSLGYRVFYGCSSLEEVIFEEGSTIATIPGYDWNSVGGTFANCTALQRVVLPETVRSIGYGAFMGCSALAEINNLDKIQSFGTCAFYMCSSLPGAINLPNCKSIGSSAFYGCAKITSVELPDNCTTVGGYAFYGCESLQSVVLSIAQTEISSSTFYGCSSLETITLPPNLVAIQDYAFYGCSRIKSLTIPEGVNTIGMRAFSYCSGLTSVVIPSNIEIIQYYTFGGCSSLSEIVFPSGLKQIEEGAFMGCSSITTLTIPDEVTIIGPAAFRNCTGLTSIIIPSSVEIIDYYAFSGCSMLSSLNIMNGVILIGQDAFSNCNNLTSVIIPSSVESISVSAFYNCTGITDLTIGDGVKTIEHQAFKNCTGLTSISFPASIETIESQAFWNCSNLTTITSHAIIPPTFYYSSLSNTNVSQIYVPVGSVEAYKTAEGWSYYANIIRSMEGGEVPPSGDGGDD